MLHRALIRTHHMTSRKKIQAITKAAKRLDCAVYLKTGAHPPGIMICECEEGGKEGLEGWVAVVKNLHYKGFQHIKSEAVETGRLDIPFGSVKEFDQIKSLTPDLSACGVAEWWEEGMGFPRKKE